MQVRYLQLLNSCLKRLKLEYLKFQYCNGDKNILMENCICKSNTECFPELYYFRKFT